MSERKIVGKYQFLPIAQVAQSVLESEGIDASLEDVEVVNIDWLLGNAVGNVKLLVPADQEVEARRILHEKQLHEKKRCRSSEEAAIDRCLSCEAPLPADVTTCPACGWSFADAEGKTIGASEEFAPMGQQFDERDETEVDQSTPSRVRLLGGTSWRKKVLMLFLFANLIGLIYTLLKWIAFESGGR